jgi:hypothetical protein
MSEKKLFVSCESQITEMIFQTCSSFCEGKGSSFL